MAPQLLSYGPKCLVKDPVLVAPPPPWHRRRCESCLLGLRRRVDRHLVRFCTTLDVFKISVLQLKRVAAQWEPRLSSLLHRFFVLAHLRLHNIC